MTPNDVAISSRVRLARNFSGVKFPRLLDAKTSQEEIEKVCSLFKENPEYRIIQLNSIPDIDKLMLVERHVISMDLVQNSEKAAVILKKDETLSVMINEEDHVRLQCLLDGIRLNEAYENAGVIDKQIGDAFKYAFHKQYGYLTACPTNLGTGLRASVMLHLPALKLTSALDSVIKAVNKCGLTVRGLYGEGSEGLGDMYQLSNQITMGHSAGDLIKAVTAMVNKIINNELKARQILYEKNKVQMDDKIYRSYGCLKYSRSLDAAEFMKLISDVKMGTSLGILKESHENVINKLIIDMQPAGITLRAGREIDSQQRDFIRAKFVRKIINESIKDEGE